MSKEVQRRVLPTPESLAGEFNLTEVIEMSAAGDVVKLEPLVSAKSNSEHLHTVLCSEEEDVVVRLAGRPVVEDERRAVHPPERAGSAAGPDQADPDIPVSGIPQQAAHVLQVVPPDDGEMSAAVDSGAFSTGRCPGQLLRGQKVAAVGVPGPLGRAGGPGRWVPDQAAQKITQKAAQAAGGRGPGSH